MPTIMRAFQLQTRDSLTFLVCTPLLAFGVLVATSTRPRQEHDASAGAWQGESGAYAGDGRRGTARAFAQFLAAVGFAQRSVLTLRQRHTNRCVFLEDAEVSTWMNEPPLADAVVTRSSDVVLGILTADCAPIFIFDPQTGVCAAIHAGWRGTLGRIVERTAEAMVTHFGTRLDVCRVAIGPTIGPCCYEVGPDVLERFRREFPYAEDLISTPTPQSRARLDLVNANVRQLLDWGFRREHIFVSGLCTACHPQLFFSHRRDSRIKGRSGLMLSVIGKMWPS